MKNYVIFRFLSSQKSRNGQEKIWHQTLKKVFHKKKILNRILWFFIGEENRYSLASAITIQVCSPNTNNLRLNELGRLAAELTAIVPLMGREWLGILQAIMPRDGNKSSYNDVCTRIDGVSPIVLAEQLAVLFGIMMARGALQMEAVINIGNNLLFDFFSLVTIFCSPGIDAA